MTASFTRISSDIKLLPTASAAATSVSAGAAETDLWIFRDGCKSVSGPRMVHDLVRRLARNGAPLLDSLIQAGELEAALVDADSSGAIAASQLTDALARIVCTGNQREAIELQKLVGRITTPDWISISPPEGFTYYALHPLDFAKIIARIPAEPRACAIIGIRSIGTTLSAMTAASLEAEGRPASRITVRPTGHPYARITQFTSEQSRWINERVSDGAQFLVVDEGPGRSGSTFLSVSEALVIAGVRQENITVLGSRQFNPEVLCAENAATRWQGFRFVSTVPSVNMRFEKCLYLGGGEWRSYLSDGEEAWPESWTQMERLKFLSPDGQTIFKFEGMGPRGSEAKERAFALGSGGFSPKVSDAGDGFLAYVRLKGRHLNREDLNCSLLETIARYCAFRVSEFTYQHAGPEQLRQMLEFNVQQEFGREICRDSDGDIDMEALASGNTVLADGRMQPHEWVAVDPGQFLKTDGISHGDNHFFPGPCHIAWDLAGTAIEWRLSPDALEFLLAKFGKFSGLEISRELPAYMLAYAVFRLGFCKMAMTTVPGTREEQRLRSAYLYYRGQALQVLGKQRRTPGSLRVQASYGP